MNKNREKALEGLTRIAQVIDYIICLLFSKILILTLRKTV
jgi:hypothetical protein